MASRSGSRRVTLAATLGPRSYKSVAAGFALSTSRSDNESDKFAGPEKGTPAPSHVSALFFAPASTPAEIQTP